MKHLLLLASFALFGLHSMAQNCEAFFTYSINENGQVVISNESVWGNEMAMFNWFVNGNLEISLPNPTFNLAPGEYEFCLEIFTTSGCADTYCTEVIVPSDCEGVNFSFESIIDPGTLIELAWLLEDAEGLDIEDGVLELILGGPNVDLDLCLPEGCYYLTLEGPVEFGMEVIVFLATLDDLNLEPFEITYDGNALSIGFSVNSDCTVNECPEEMWHGPAELCGCYIFEIGSFVDGQEVLWNFGDGTTEEGGHFADHCFEANGEYVVTANYSSPVCEEAVYEALIVVDCYNQCELDVEYVIDECEGTALFEAYNFPDGATINWYVNSEMEIYESGVSTFDIQLEEGEHYVCASYESIQCEETIWWCKDISIIDCGPICPEAWDYEISGDDCLTVTFNWEYTPNGEEFTETTYAFGDGNFDVTYELSSTHTYDEPGTYTISSTFSAEQCGDGLTVSEQTITVGECEDPCGLSIDQVAIECGWMLFEASDYPPGTTVWWQVDGEYLDETGPEFDIEFDDYEIHTVCAFFETPECPEGTWACLDVEALECESDCPTETYMGEQFNCGCYEFEIGSFADGAFIEWDFGDGTTMESGHFTQHCYEEDGEYVITALYNSPTCQNQLYTLGVADVNCEIGPCDLELDLIEIECGWMLYEASGYPEGTTIWWQVDGEYLDETGPLFDIEFDDLEGHVVCAYYETPECPQGSFICLDAVAQECEGDCPTDFYMGETEECGCYVFEIGSFVEGESVLWEFGDGTTLEGGHFAEHCYEEDGEYVVTAMYSSPNCQNQLYTLGVAEVNCEIGPCDLEIDLIEIECGWMMFEASGYPEGTTVWWEVDEVFTGESGSLFDVEFDDMETHYVCAVFETPECPQGTWACMDVEAMECGNDCPTDIYMGEQDDCGCYEFEIGSFVEGEFVLWDFGDGTTYEGGHYVDYCYEEDGEYVVTAVYNSPVCQNQVYTLGVANVNCVIDPCDISMEIVEEECGWYYFEAYDFPAETTIWWEVDDEWLNISGGGLEYIFEEGGLHTVCAFFETPECPQGTWACEEIYVDLCNDCPGSMYVGEADDCGCFEFEVGSFQEGEVVEWDFGDGTIETGGHYITHCYEEPYGEHIVTAFFTSNLCPDGVWLTGIAEYECESCTEVGFAFDTDWSNDGPEFVTWIVSDSEGEPVQSGTCEYTENNQWCDWGMCLEDGCYEVLISTGGGSNSEIWDGFFSQAFMNGEAIEYAEGPETNDLNQLIYTFGVNSDCGVGIGDFQTAELVIFPNPAHTSFTITGLDKLDNPRVQLFDMKGSLVFSDQIVGNSETIFLSSNTQGIYHLVVVSDDQMISKKIQVIK